MSRNSEFAKLYPLEFGEYGDILYAGTIDAIENYYYKGYIPGGFVYHLLCNDLVGAASRADAWNAQVLAHYASWMEEKMPRCAWGSKEIVDAWMEDF